MPSLVDRRAATPRSSRPARDGRARASLAVVLPGERQADVRLVERVVADLNRLYTRKGLETARALGEYLLAAFFNGDPAEFHRRGGSHLSFRELAGRTDLQMSSSFLWSCVAIVEQLRLLPADLVQALPLSHHKLLLPVRDEREKLELARQAIREGLTRRDLEGEIRRRRGASSAPEAGRRRPGRPPHPPLMRALSQVKRALGAVLGDEWVSTGGRGVPVARAEVLLDEIEGQLERLERALGALRARVAPR